MVKYEALVCLIFLGFWMRAYKYYTNITCLDNICSCVITYIYPIFWKHSDIIFCSWFKIVHQSGSCTISPIGGITNVPGFIMTTAIFNIILLSISTVKSGCPAYFDFSLSWYKMKRAWWFGFTWYTMTIALEQKKNNWQTDKPLIIYKERAFLGYK